MSNSTSKWFKYLTEEKTICEMCGKHHDMEMCPGHDDDVRKVDHHDREGKMAKRQLHDMEKYARELSEMLTDTTQLESWVQAKLTKAADYLKTVKHYVAYGMEEGAYDQVQPEMPMMADEFEVEPEEMMAIAEDEI